MIASIALIALIRMDADRVVFNGRDLAFGFIPFPTPLQPGPWQACLGWEKCSLGPLEQGAPPETYKENSEISASLFWGLHVILPTRFREQSVSSPGLAPCRSRGAIGQFAFQLLDRNCLIQLSMGT